MPNIRPSADLRNKYPEIARICKEEQQPVFITVNGRGDTVLMSIEEYDRITLLQNLAAARDDITNGRVYTHEEFWGRFDKKIEAMKEQGLL